MNVPTPKSSSSHGTVLVAKTTDLGESERDVRIGADDTTEGQDAHGGREQHLGATKDAEFRADPRILRC